MIDWGRSDSWRYAPSTRPVSATRFRKPSTPCRCTASRPRLPLGCSQGVCCGKTGSKHTEWQITFRASNSSPAGSITRFSRAMGLRQRDREQVRRAGGATQKLLRYNRLLSSAATAAGWLAALPAVIRPTALSAPPTLAHPYPLTAHSLRSSTPQPPPSSCLPISRSSRLVALPLGARSSARREGRPACSFIKLLHRTGLRWGGVGLGWGVAFAHKVRRGGRPACYFKRLLHRT